MIEDDGLNSLVFGNYSILSGYLRKCNFSCVFLLVLLVFKVI